MFIVVVNISHESTDIYYCQLSIIGNTNRYSNVQKYPTACITWTYI